MWHFLSHPGLSYVSGFYLDTYHQVQQICITSASAATTATLSLLSSKRTVRSTQNASTRRLRGGEPPYSRAPLRLKNIWCELWCCTSTWTTRNHLKRFSSYGQTDTYTYTRLAVVLHDSSEKYGVLRGSSQRRKSSMHSNNLSSKGCCLSTFDSATSSTINRLMALVGPRI